MVLLDRALRGEEIPNQQEMQALVVTPKGQGTQGISLHLERVETTERFFR